MIKNLKLYIKNLTLILKENILKIKHYNFIKLIPHYTKHDDVYLVSYPRSGSNWLSFLIANASLKYFKINREVNFFNIHHLIPDIDSGRDIEKDIYPLNSRVIKSHSFFNPFYKSVFYLIRHPDDVMISYFKFLSDLGQYKGNISEFIRTKKFGINAWKKHVESWLSYNNPALGIIVFRYEDLKKDSSKEILKAFKYLGYALSDADAKFAAEKSSFINMKKMEQEIYTDGRLIVSGFEFVRKGSSNENTDLLTLKDKEFIRGSVKRIMEKFHYS
tara:strand:- start:95 stop:916 length:822 start_codon:yes stop_codon:yes gene_type:complete